MSAPISLPINDVLPEISTMVARANKLVLAAPPGAGKTSCVPLALKGLLDQPCVIEGKILLLEPRRVAARMAAERMAKTLSERVGDRIGLSTRIDRKVSKNTQIEVITDGLFARRILADPELTGIGAVIFDEFHERRLNGDLGVALALDAQAALRDDLRLIVMSATLDTETVAAAIDAPIIESEGRQYPVETIYLGRSTDRLDVQMERAIRKAIHQEEGSILAFLPGAADIRRVAERLEDLPKAVVVAPLFGALSPAEQDAAVSPTRDGVRKVVLATNIAESALTIDGVTIVIDSGMARVAEDQPGAIGSRLTTVRASKASVDQRRGRAGRTAPGICYRLWDEAATRGLSPAPVPEILTRNLSGLLLALGEWGETDASRMIWIDPPPQGRLQAARTQLESLGALDDDGRLTELGREMSGYPLSPQLAALVAGAPPGPERALAAEIAALASERGMGGQSVDLRERLTRFRGDRSGRGKALLQQAKKWGGGVPPSADAAPLLARAWPQQIARRRPDQTGAYVLTSGRAARLRESDPLAKADWLVVVDMGGGTKESWISLACPMTETQALEGGQVKIVDVAAFDPDTKRVSARRVKRMGAIILSETPQPKPAADVAVQAILDAVQTHGFAVLGCVNAIQETANRLDLLEKSGMLEKPGNIADWQASADVWLSPLLRKSLPGLPTEGAIRQSLIQSMDWPVQELLRRQVPLECLLETGRRFPIDYLSPRAPLIRGRAQVFYGMTRHPSLADGRIAITVELLSPAQRVVATTQDLPAFWEGGYADMAKDMRSQYPKHDWPEMPAQAKPHEGLTKKRLNADR